MVQGLRTSTALMEDLGSISSTYVRQFTTVNRSGSRPPEVQWYSHVQMHHTHRHKPSAEGSEAGALQIGGQPGVQSEILEHIHTQDCLLRIQ